MKNVRNLYYVKFYLPLGQTSYCLLGQQTVERFYGLNEFWGVISYSLVNVCLFVFLALQPIVVIFP
jgi:hypothetical protein